MLYVAGPTHNFIQVGSDIVFDVGRDGKTCYDPVHGITLHVPNDSLPPSTEGIKITIKVGFTDHDLGSDMVMCSAVVAIQCVPPITFTKDVFLEVPHSVSSADASDLCFVKFQDETGYAGEIYNGIFPTDYPYGVIMINSFSSYVIVKGKRYFYSQSSLRKRHLPQYKRHLQSRNWHRITKFDQSNLICFWLGITKISTNNENNNTFSFMVAQYTPTGFNVSDYNTIHCVIYIL